MTDVVTGASCPDHEEANDGVCEHRCDQSATRKHWHSGACYRCDQSSTDKYYQDNTCVSECGYERAPDGANDCKQVDDEPPAPAKVYIGKSLLRGVSAWCRACLMKDSLRQGNIHDYLAGTVQADCIGC